MKFNLSQTDFYTKKAKEEGFPARSVYKLKEINKRFNLLKKGDKVLDLGCSPGSWLLYLSEKVGENGKVVGVDLHELKIQLKENIVFLLKDVLKDDLLQEKIFAKKFNLVVSDLAPKTTGLKERDAALSLELCQRAFEIAQAILVKGGNFVCKAFESPDLQEFLKEVQGCFTKAQLFRTSSTTKHSREVFVVALDFINKNP
ncbi:RlmE family RNA methyltransferase [Candidatus Parcubacteria bacterium]|nr:RlmE family RNA methyltransferase [Candidatus Parcubacteria bacterium]